MGENNYGQLGGNSSANNKVSQITELDRKWIVAIKSGHYHCMYAKCGCVVIEV